MKFGLYLCRYRHKFNERRWCDCQSDYQ